MAIFLLALLFAAQCVAQGDQFYRGFQVLRVNVTSKEQMELFSDLEAEYDDESFDMWTYPNVERQVQAVVCVSPSILTKVKTLFDERSMQYTISVADLQQEIDQEQFSNEELLRRKKRSTTTLLQEMMSVFPRFTEHRTWLVNLARNYPGNVELLNLGVSYEKRNITGVRIRSNSSSAAGKRVILIDGGIHGREHLSVSTCNYLISVLLGGLQQNDTEVVDLLRKYDVVIVPILNPDGYEATHTGRRMWRKNRKQFSRRCIGVDVNRNFEMGYDTASYEEMRCHSAIYRGEKAFSEKESLALQKFVMNNRFRIDFYFNLHAYSQFILFPWGYTIDPIDDYDELLRVAQAGATAIQKMFNETFAVGVPPILLYPAPGAAMDWVKSMGVKYSYAIEVRPGSDRGHEGFLATIDMIKPSGDDIFVALKAMVRAANNSTVTSG